MDNKKPNTKTRTAKKLDKVNGKKKEAKTFIGRDGKKHPLPPITYVN